MKWLFSTESTLEEVHTGYTISLLAGSWKEPINIEPKAPHDMSIHEQAKYMRAAFQHVASLEKKKKRTFMDLFPHKHEGLENFTYNFY